jgi:uncharacterized C2H2 Zn-finger protein
MAALNIYGSIESEGTMTELKKCPICGSTKYQGNWFTRHVNSHKGMTIQRLNQMVAEQTKVKPIPISQPTLIAAVQREIDRLEEVKKILLEQ